MPDPPDPAAYFGEAQECFFKARGNGDAGARDAHFEIADRVIRVSFANEAMVSVLTPAFEHLRTKPTPHPALTILVWDGLSTGIGLPPGPWPERVAVSPAPCPNQVTPPPAQWLGHRGTVWLLNQAGEAFSLLDEALGTAIYFVPDARGIPWYEAGSPFRVILHWWSTGCSRQLLHGAAVGTRAGAVLIGGKGGAGKSTTALTCLKAGLDYLGDDYVMVKPGDRPVVYSLYRTAKLDPHDLSRFPWLRGALGQPGGLSGRKALMFLPPNQDQSPGPGLPLRALVVPRITAREQPVLRRMAPAAALAALAPSTMFQLPGAAGAILETVADLVRRLPAYVLELGSDMSGVPPLIGDLAG